MDYVKIPQNVRIEDKLIGPLSLRQIGLIAIGGGISYALFSGLQKTYGTVPPVAHAFIWIPAIFFTAFAVIRIYDISLFRYALLILETLSRPRRRVWQPRKGLFIEIESPVALAKYEKKKQKEEKIKKDKEEDAGRKSDIPIDELSVILDQGLNPKGVSSSPLHVSDDSTAAAQIALDKEESEIAEHSDRLDTLWKSMKAGSGHTRSSS